AEEPVPALTLPPLSRAGGGEGLPRKTPPAELPLCPPCHAGGGEGPLSETPPAELRHRRGFLPAPPLAEASERPASGAGGSRGGLPLRR
ncbi:unnamed protein product, partial [Staurois parvus]